MTWRLATSLSTLRAEINAAYPNRDKASDGTIGDAAHATRNSDHNPWIIDGHGVGVVRAFDCDEDLYGAGKTPDPSPLAAIAERIRKMGEAGDRRLADWGYVIYEGRIAGGNPSRPNRWTWRPYSGSNAHKIHMHVSVSRNQAGYDDPSPWNVTATPPPPAPKPPTGDLTMSEAAAIRAEIAAKDAKLRADVATMDRLIMEQVRQRDALIIGWAKDRLGATEDDVADLERRLADLEGDET